MTNLLTEAQPFSLEEYLALRTSTEYLRWKQSWQARYSPAGLAAIASQGRWETARHLAYLDQKIVETVERGGKLLITMPPRHGKSMLASQYLPAWYLGTRPDKRIILASYEAKFAASWGRKVRDILNEWGQQLYGIDIRSDSKAADRWDIQDRLGGMMCAGIGGPITGKGADLLIIDDPVKSSKEANSEIIRESTWEWYVSTAYTRLEPGASLIIIQTRWHEDDLAGRILAQDRESQEWMVCNLPALATQEDQLSRDFGQALWPRRFDCSALANIKKVAPPYWWDALYQQNPTSAEGGLFKRSWFRYYSEPEGAYRLGGRLVPLHHCRTFATMDLAFSEKKDADYTVIAAWAVTPRSELLLLDLVRERMAAHELVPAARSLCERFKCDYIGIEQVLGQSLVVHGARMEGLNVKSLLADKDKISRSIPAQIRMQGEQVWFPENASWLREFEHELLTFPRGTHDDQVDALSYAATEVQRFGSGPGLTESEEEDVKRQSREDFLALLEGR